MRDSAYIAADCDEPSPTASQFADWETIRALHDEIEELQAELAGAKEDRDAWEAEVKDNRARIDADAFNVLQAVRDWFDSWTVFKKPMSDPRTVRRLVEDVLS